MATTNFEAMFYRTLAVSTPLDTITHIEFSVNYLDTQGYRICVAEGVQNGGSFTYDPTEYTTVKPYTDVLLPNKKRDSKLAGKLLSYIDRFKDDWCKEYVTTFAKTKERWTAFEGMKELIKKLLPLHFKDSELYKPDHSAEEKLLYKNAVANDELRPVMNGVYHDNGFLVASDSKILAKLKNPNVNPDQEGKIIDKYGHEVEGRFPRYEAVIPKSYAHEQAFDLNELDRFCKDCRDIYEAQEQGRKIGYTKIVLPIGEQRICVDGQRLRKMIPFMRLMGSNLLQIRDSTSPLTARNLQTGAAALIMPMMCNCQEPEKEDEWGTNLFLYTPSNPNVAPLTATAPEPAPAAPAAPAVVPAARIDSNPIADWFRDALVPITNKQSA